MNKSSKAKTTTNTPKKRGRPRKNSAIPEKPKATKKLIAPKIGRPSLISDENEKQEVIASVLRHIADGLSLPQIEALPGMPKRTTLNDWIATNKNGVSDAYAHAREARADRIAREIFEIADTAPDDNPAAVQKAKLRADVRRWYLSKILPEKYGDNLTVKSSGTLQVAHIGAVAIADVRKVRAMLDSAIAPADDDLTENNGVQTADNC